jgi:hypothetical protein
MEPSTFILAAVTVLVIKGLFFTSAKEVADYIGADL